MTNNASSRNGYEGCGFLKSKVVSWSLYSLFVGIALVVVMATTSLSTKDLVSWWFAVQRVLSWTLSPGDTPSSELSTIDEREASAKALAERMDVWVKSVYWAYALLSTARGTFGVVGVGLEDPYLIKLLWYTTIAGSFFDLALVSVLPIVCLMQGTRFAWYFWLWGLLQFGYLVWFGWNISETMFRFYRVLDIGGAHQSDSSLHALEEQLLPNEKSTHSP